ncbi:MAG: lactate utilization protein C [Thermoleophilia bacterium]
MSTTAAMLLEALERRRGGGEIVGAAGAADAARRVAAGWDSTRALVAADPLLDRIGVPDALAGDGIELLRWPEGRGAGWRELLGLDGPTATIGITVPTLAVAERGTLVLSTGPAHGRSIDVVSERHLAVLPASRIRATLAEALAERFRSGGRPPSAVSLVSGPSRTSDIEKISTLGAHGALSMHVLIIEDL